MPVTITLVDSGRLVYVFSIHFDKNNVEETSRAHQLYKECFLEWEKQGVGPYRQGLLSMGPDYLNKSNNAKIFSEFKKILDPDNIISRGRYNLGLTI